MKNNWRQKLHLEPQKGWLNDPNGLSYFNGNYHVYFQFSPDSPLGGGDKCWGHWQSADLLDWQFTGTVLRPDIHEDRNGVYSGCGIVENDVLHLFYTGNVKEEGDYDYIRSGRGANVISVTTKNGHDMSEKQVLLRNADYPDNCSCHVRDPKVWKDGNVYRMVLGARTLDDKGCVLFYSSEDLKNWKYGKTLSIPDFGYMWECPDYLNIDGRNYLSVSPQGLPHEKYRFQNVYSSGCFKVDGDKLSDYQEWDYGFDFYAPQTFKAPDGRNIIIGWMGIGDIPYHNPTAALGWQHCLTVPREIMTDKNGQLLQRPVSELQKLRKDKNDLLSGMKVQLPFELLAECEDEFYLRLNEYLYMEYLNGVFILEFTNSDVGCGRTIRRAKLERCRKIHILADTSSIEIFLDHGEKVLSTRFYPDDTEVMLTCSGLSGNVFQLNEMEVRSDG